MRNILSTFIIILFGWGVVSGKTNSNITTNSLMMAPQIDSVDKVVYDIEKAVIKGNYVFVPVYFLSNDPILSIDFEMKFNNIKLTYDSVINFKSYLAEIAHYNSGDQKLRLTSSASDINNFLPIENNTPLFAVRFHFNTPNICNKIFDTDISSVKSYLNGDPSSTEITTTSKLDFSTGNNIACVGLNAFTPSSTKIINDTISSWFWDFGNGTTSNVSNPTANYTSPATYTVVLIAQSSAGCPDTVKKVIEVHSAPLGAFTFSPDCTTGNITFIDLSSITSGLITNWNWNFGDSLGSHQMNPKHNYILGGTYTVTLTAISDSGCTSSSSQSVPIDILSANYKPMKGCIGEPINFTDLSTSTPTSGAITDWQWYFGDASSTTSTLQNPTYIYPVAGIYNVSLKVSNFNCADSISKVVIIENKPIVKFTEDKITGCMPLTVNFLDSSPVESPSTYTWEFNTTPDTTTSSLGITHTYNANGLYSVKHYVTTSAGCTDSLEKLSYINVYGVVAAFTASPTKVKLPHATVTFKNISNSYSNWTWNFGDSIYSSDKMPEHTFSEVGVYAVCLTGVNSNGCKSNFCDTITVENANVIAIPSAFTPNGDNANDILKVKGGPVKEMEFRIFNEWGNQVFISNNQNDGWDGNFNGAPQAVGVYEYSLKGKTMDNELIDMHNVVNLVR